jgi:arsenate reductase
MNILVLCTGNSCRSQIAEGFLKNKLPNHNIYSAGIETHGVNPKAVKTMYEAGIDISNHTSNLVDEYLDVDFNHIITVCDHASENCPHIPSQAKRHHCNFPDPSKATGTEEEIMIAFAQVRDLIDEYTTKFKEIEL